MTGASSGSAVLLRAWPEWRLRTLLPLVGAIHVHLVLHELLAVLLAGEDDEGGLRVLRARARTVRLSTCTPQALDTPGALRTCRYMICACPVPLSSQWPSSLRQ